MKTIFDEGKYQGIAEVLGEKDRRVKMQETIFKKYPDRVLVDVKMNIPGPIKNNQYLEMMFKKGIDELEGIFLKNNLSYKLVVSWNYDTGCENFYIVDNKINYVKKYSVKFEDKSELGRLFDADVLIKSKKQAISRKDLGLPARKCFICSHPAKECARSRRHSIEELQNYIFQIYRKNFKNQTKK
ncbi:citrate lyase holo-[acyl-carrier protein] synthase [Lactobacillus sp. PSON]|uniref:citrate lyase holo-[acyl-carrier protein] synthase n=1 Tax=Lactobacillus sp. PSON TaxID=3455454 RepID=UPI004042657B